MINREQSGRSDESDSFQMNEDLVNRSRMASHRPLYRLATTHHRVDSTRQHFDHLIFPVHRASIAGRTARLLWRSTRLLRVEMMFNMRMSRVNITVPDDVAAQARAAGLNVSRVATAALVEELDRRAKTKALDAYLLQLENELGPVSAHEQADAVAWAERVLAPTSRQPSAKHRRSA